MKEARLELARDHANDVAANRVLETRRLEDDVQRFSNRDVLQLASKRLGDRGIRNDAQAGAAHEDRQEVLDRSRACGPQGDAPAVEHGMTRLQIELRNRHRPQRRGRRRLLPADGHCRENGGHHRKNRRIPGRLHRLSLDSVSAGTLLTSMMSK